MVLEPSPKMPTCSFNHPKPLNAPVIWNQHPGPLAVNFLLCAGGFVATLIYIPQVSELFIAAGCFGKDLNKKGQPQMYAPECVYLAVGFI